MKKTRSYTHYTSMKNSFGRRCSVSSDIGIIDFEIKVKAFLPSDNKYIEQNISILSNLNYVIYSCNDKIKLLNFRVGFAPREWSHHRQYIEGDCVFYNGEVYSVRQYDENKSNPTNITYWNKAYNYEPKAYTKNDIVLFGDNRYYIAISDLSSGDKPNTSNKWKKVAGDFTLYASINENATFFETILVKGNESLITLYPYDSKTFYVLDSWYQVIDGVNYATPVIKGYDEKEYGRLFTLEDSIMTNKITTSDNKSGGSLFYNFMTVKDVKVTNILLTLKIENMWFGDEPILGYAKCLIYGADFNSTSALIRYFALGEHFNSNNLNLIFTKHNNEIKAYLETHGNRFRITIDGLDCYSNKEDRINQSSSIIKIHNTPETLTNIEGNIVEKMFW